MTNDKFADNEFEVMADKDSGGIGLALSLPVAELLLQCLLSVNSSFMNDEQFSSFAALKTDLRVHIEEIS